MALKFLWTSILFLTGCNLIAQPQTALPSPTADAAVRLTVAWSEAGSLMVWREGETPRRVASGGVIRPYLAPDGEHILFTRGPDGQAESLWVVDVAGTAEQELVGRDEMRPWGEGTPMIGDVGWYDDSVLYFNLANRMQVGQQRRDDLYRANIRTREVSLIMPPTEGGYFTFSPDKTRIALVYPGTYGRQDGRIRVIDPLAMEEPINMLFFIGVATGSEYAFYPRVFWTPESDALYTAIPNEDLVYDDVNAPPTALWRLGLDRNREQIGVVPASFFGQPRWSSDTTQMTYAQRIGDPTSNQFDVLIADNNGENPETYFEGDIGSFQPPEWIPGLTRFIYQQGDAGQTWIGGAGVNPVEFPNDQERILAPIFAGNSIVVFTAASGDVVELRYASLDALGEPSRLIATLQGVFPIYDAVATS
jgi:hypothetical protein